MKDHDNISAQCHNIIQRLQTLEQRVEHLDPSIQRLERQIRLLGYRSHRDILTGLLNRGAFERQLRCIGVKCVFATFGGILMGDLDRLAVINETFGVATGDQVLRQVGKTLRRNLRPQDLVGRWADDEFVIWLPGLNPEQSRAVAERLWDAVAGLRIPVTRDEVLEVSMSMGLYSWPISDCTYRQAIHYAGQAMTRAKMDQSRLVIWQNQS